MNKYSLWLLPPKGIQLEFSEIVEKYSKKLNFPSFEPHATIVGEFEGEKNDVVNKISSVTNISKKIAITISEISISTTYFQCVFARINPTPRIIDLQMNVIKALDLKSSNFFMPHISLVYGAYPSVVKYEIAKEINLKTKEFQAEKLCLINANDYDPATWEHVAEFELK